MFERHRLVAGLKFNRLALAALVAAAAIASPACGQKDEQPEQAAAPTPTAAPAAGVRMIPITTADGTFKVWTQKIGDNPDMKVLILHGGPGFDHEYLEAFQDFLPPAGIEMYFYDQLGSFGSDQPDDDDLWTIDRFVDEVDQVRTALGLDANDFFLFGHSWGGILGIEYALKHQDALKGLIISNMMASIPEYNRYAREVLEPQMDQKALAEIKALEAAGDYDNPRYMDLLMSNYYVKHLLRLPPEKWPDSVNRSFEHVNNSIYVLMQGPSEFGASGRLANWDRSAGLSRITVPTLVIGARYGTMDPAYMRWMSQQLPNGQYLECPNGSHCAFIDDQQVYFDGLIKFIRGVAGETGG